MVKNNRNKNNSSKSLVFGRWPQTKNVGSSNLPERALVEGVRPLSREVTVAVDGLAAEVALQGPAPPAGDLVAAVLLEKK